MAETKTRSAQSTSSARRGATLVSTRRNWYSGGSIAATVSSPSGGMTAFRRTTGNAYL